MIYIDFETRSKCDLIKAGAWQYSQHPSTEVLCMAWAIDDGEVQLWKPGDPMPFEYADILEIEFEAHNSAFENAIWLNTLGWPKVNWTCSAAKCAAHSLPRALDKAGEALGLSEQKDQEGKRIMMKLCKPRKPTKNNPNVWHEDPADYAILYEYCKDDVRAERALSKALRNLNETETKVWKLDQIINERGINVDMDAVDAAMTISNEYLERTNEDMAVVTDGAVLKASETKKLTDWIRSKGVQLFGVTKAEVTALLNTTLPVAVRDALMIRQRLSKTSIAKYKAIKRAACDDGRLRGLLMYHGAGTGRWTGKTVQPHNFPRNSFKGSLDDYFHILKMGKLSIFELCYPDVMGMISALIRPCLIPTEGTNFYGGDYSSIEARVLLWLAEDEDGLEVFRAGKDIYKDMACDIYGIKIEDVSDIQRQLGKQAILGLGYQMGANKFEQTCLGYNIHIDAALAEKVVGAYREKYIKVKTMWYAQEAAAIRAVVTGKFQSCGKIGWGISGDFLYCKLPSKRLIAYYKPQLKTVKVPWGEKKALTYMSMNSVTRKWEETKTYGGKIVENITQGVARDVMAEAMLRLEDADYKVILTVHDEVITEKEVGNVKEFEAIMCTNPEWCQDLPTAVGGWVGQRYLK